MFFGLFKTNPARAESDGHTVRSVERSRLQMQHHVDTAEARKEAWLRAQRPRLSKGTSGEWWCVSVHHGPDRTRPTQYMRIGHGVNPAEAYVSWKNY